MDGLCKIAVNMMNTVLINTNMIKPPIAPVGLEYIAEALKKAGHHVDLLDLCWEEDPDIAVKGFFDKKTCNLVGLTLRNTDDCVFTSRRSFLDGFSSIVSAVRDQTDALIVIGGVGFSTMPEKVMELCGADAGIWGDGEAVFTELANRLEEKLDWLDLPNLVVCRNGRWQRNPASAGSLINLPQMNRHWVDNRRYFKEGGQVGFETKRGCAEHCIYCADPLAKGETIRVRPPEAVVYELKRLLGLGIDHMHTCDSEFNIPLRHALEVCGSIISNGLGSRLRWYAYCSPVPFTSELAGLMREAGCAGINFGVDSGDAGMLKRLNRNFTPDDILVSARYCRNVGIAVMLDLLLGSPGETEESIVRTVELMRRVGAAQIGVSVGVRVYPGTVLEKQVGSGELKNGLVGGDDRADPVFFLEPGVSDFIFELLDKQIGDDRHFFFFDPSKPDRNYNYNSNQRLVDAIGEGYRGAYWDILRRYSPKTR